MKRFLRISALLLALALPFVLLRFETTRAMFVSLMAYMRDAGPAGVGAFFAMEVLGGALVFPIWLMAGIAGYVFGFAKGVLLAVPGVTLAAITGFVIGRLFLKGLLGAQASSNLYLRAVSRVAATEGAKITLLLRLTPVMPQNLMGYLLSSTPIRFRDFVIGTFVGLVPITTFQVYAGSMVQSAAALIAGEAHVGGVVQWVAIGGGLVLCVAGLVVVARIGRRALNETLAQGASAPEQAP
jgi:uncharacterized membrane protein YdjX (TVP38/TMEM64 family)